MSEQADNLLNCVAHWQFERLTRGADLEFWHYKCRAHAAEIGRAK